MVDTRGIALALGDAEVHVSDAATVEQDSAPQGASDAPTAASATLISAFQEDILYIKVTIYCDWLLVRPGAASLLTGASY